MKVISRVKDRVDSLRSKIESCEKVHNNPQQTLFKVNNTCSKSIIETEGKDVKHVQVGNENTRMTSMTSLWCFYC